MTKIRNALKNSIYKNYQLFFVFFNLFLIYLIIILINSCVIWDDSGLLNIKKQGLSISFIPMWIPGSLVRNDLDQKTSNEFFANEHNFSSLKHDWLFRKIRIKYLNKYIEKNPTDLILISSLIDMRDIFKANSEFKQLKYDLSSDPITHFFKIYQSNELDYFSAMDIYSGLIFAPSKELNINQNSQNFAKIWPWQINRESNNDYTSTYNKNTINKYIQPNFIGAELFSVNYQKIPILFLKLMINSENTINKYKDVVRILKIFLDQNTNYCSQRLIVYGYLPNINQDIKTHFKKLNLVDSSINACFESDCNTGSIDNPLFNLKKSEHNHKILVPSSAELLSSERILDNKFDFSILKLQITDNFFPLSAFYGWKIRINLQKTCD